MAWIVLVYDRDNCTRMFLVREKKKKKKDEEVRKMVTRRVIDVFMGELLFTVRERVKWRNVTDLRYLRVVQKRYFHRIRKLLGNRLFTS